MLRSASLGRSAFLADTAVTMTSQRAGEREDGRSQDSSFVGYHGEHRSLRFRLLNSSDRQTTLGIRSSALWKAEFEQKQVDMREQVVKFEKFIQENDAKRIRAEAKAKQVGVHEYPNLVYGTCDHVSPYTLKLGASSVSADPVPAADIVTVSPYTCPGLQPLATGLPYQHLSQSV